MQYTMSSNIQDAVDSKYFVFLTNFLIFDRHYKFSKGGGRKFTQN